MSALEIEKIYQSKEEIREYQKAIEESGNWKFIEICLWDFNFPQFLEKQRLGDKKLEAWNRLYGFLDDLTPEEWQQFNEAIERRPLFGKIKKGED